jgi:NAD(P)H-dependent FMN reductase
MITIICGTNRQEAVSKKLSRIYKSKLDLIGQPSQVIDLSDLPSDFAFSALYGKSGKNEEFNLYRKQMLESNKFIFIVPEYNGSFPGVLKTFIDGLQFPDTFKNKICTLTGRSSGVQGGGLALSHLTDIFNYCGMHVLPLKPKLARISENMDMEREEITNSLYQELIDEQIKGLIEF